jgi:hypothetical protein
MTEEVLALRIDDDPSRPIDVITASALLVWDPRSDSQPTKKREFPPARGRCERIAAFARSRGAYVISGVPGQLWLGSANGLAPLAVPGMTNACAEALAMSPDGQRIAVSVMSPRPHIVVYDVHKSRPVGSPATEYLVRSLAFDPHGELLAFTVGVRPASPSENPEVSLELWSMLTGKRISSRPLVAQGLRIPACLDPAGQLVGSASGRIAQLFDHGSGQLSLRATQALPSSVRFCQFSRDGRRVAVGSAFGLRLMSVLADDIMTEAIWRLAPAVEGAWRK